MSVRNLIISELDLAVLEAEKIKHRIAVMNEMLKAESDERYKETPSEKIIKEEKMKSPYQQRHVTMCKLFLRYLENNERRDLEEEREDAKRFRGWAEEILKKLENIIKYCDEQEGVKHAE